MIRDISKAVLDRPFARYMTAIVVVAASFLLRYFLVQGLGLAMPTFITFYPGIMLVAVLAGLWPGLLATALAVLAVDYLILPPFGSLAIAKTSDAIALVLFATMGILISLLAEGYRRSLLSIAAYKEEQALWVSNEKLDVALASMTDAVFISDAKGQFIQFNDAFASFHRFRNKSECARTLTEYPEFLEVSMADGQLAPLEMWAVPRALRGETAANEEYRLRRKDTGETWIGSYSFGPVRDHEGAIIGSVVVGRDITEQKRAEEALRKSETLYRGLFDSMDEGFCIIEMIFDAEGKAADYRFLEINAAFERQTGLHEAAGKRMRELAPTHEEYWFEIYGKIALTGEPAHFLNEANALKCYYEVSAYRVGEPELRQVAIVFNDISARLHTEEALKLSMEQLQIFVEHAPASLAMFDLDMRYICASRRWSADYGLGDRDLRGVSHYDIFPEIPERWKEAHRRARAGEVVQAEDDSFLRADGSLQRLRWEIHPWHEPSGGVGGIVVFTEDITERKRAEAHIRRLSRIYAVLSDINETIVREKDSQAMLEAACRIAVDKGQFLMAWIGMADPETHSLKPIASSGLVDGYLDGAEIDLRDTDRPNRLPARSFHSRQYAISNDIQNDQDYLPWRDEALRRGYRSAGSFPLKVDGRVVGTFNLYASMPGFFEGDELPLLTKMAMDISFALEVYQLEERRLKAEEHVKQLNRLYSVLSDVNQTIVREKDSQVMLETACRIAVEKGKLQMAWIGMVDPVTKLLEPVACSGVVEGFLDLGKISVQDPDHASRPAVRCIASGKHAICNDIEQEIAFRPLREEALRRGYWSWGGFPLKVDGQTVGAFILYANEKGFFEGDDVSLLDEMAMDISFALEVARNEKNRTRAEQHVRQLVRVYAVLSDINETIVREKDSQAMLEAACRIAVDKGQFLMAWVGMADPAAHMLRPIASSGKVGDYLDHVQLDFLDPARSAGPSARCFLSGEHAVCNAIEQDPLFAPWRDDALRMGYRSHASFPLKVDAQVVGIFSLYSSQLAFFDEDEIKLLDELAMDIGFALEVNHREEDRRKAEEELRWRTAFFEAQVDSAQDGVLVVDGKGKKILQNQRLNELLKLPRDVFENPDFAERIQFLAGWVKNPDQFFEKVQFLISHPEEISRDVVELLDGTILERFSSPVIDKAQNHYGRIWTFRDITERRQLEEQFRQSQKMEAVGQLTGGIAHDFNNLLTVILGCSEFIGEEAKGNPRLSKMAKMILDAAQRGADLTHRMLAFARRQALQPKPIDIHRMVANMESILRRTLSADIDLEVIQSREDCTALVDLTQLENALLNLCMNAWDAMPGGGKLIVETGIATLDSSYAEQNADVTPGKYVLISVSDTGCGISPENLDRVFDPFFTTKEVGKGTGLGLSMVYGFVKQSQGHVKIYSEPGEGTSVKLYLPKADQESEPSNQEAILIADLHGSEVVLLVEDNAPVREFARTQLLHLGYQVLEAANGKDALPILREHPEIELLFTDVVMSGGLNGRELALEARKLHPALKVLFCSGYAESAILYVGLLDEHVQLLNKPYSRLQLAKRIRGMLTASPSAPVEEERNG